MTPQLCGCTASEDPVKEKRAECERPHGVESEVSKEYRRHPLTEPMVPLPWNAHQCCGADEDDPPDEPEHVGLPHCRREHDERRPDQQTKDLLYVVRSRGAREKHQESLGNRRFREDHAREGDQEEAKRDNHERRQQAHGLGAARGFSASSVKPAEQSQQRTSNPEPVTRGDSRYWGRNTAFIGNHVLTQHPFAYQDTATNGPTSRIDSISSQPKSSTLQLGQSSHRPDTQKLSSGMQIA